MTRGLVKKPRAPRKSRASLLTEILYKEWISLAIIT